MKFITIVIQKAFPKLVVTSPCLQ